MKFDVYLLLKKGARGPITTLYAKQPKVGSNEVSFRLKLDVPDEMFTRPPLELSVSVPRGAAPDIHASREQIEEAFKKITGHRVQIELNEFTT